MNRKAYEENDPMGVNGKAIREAIRQMFTEQGWGEPTFQTKENMGKTPDLWTDKSAFEFQRLTTWYAGEYPYSQVRFFTRYFHGKPHTVITEHGQCFHIWGRMDNKAFYVVDYHDIKANIGKVVNEDTQDRNDNVVYFPRNIGKTYVLSDTFISRKSPLQTKALDSQKNKVIP